MFLVCASDKGQNNLLNKIKTLDFFCDSPTDNFEFLAIMHLMPIKENILQVEHIINRYNYVILVSPNCIEFAKSAIVSATDPEFMVMGYESYKLLTNMTSRNIFYPKQLTGSGGLMEEVVKTLDLLNKKVLIISGEVENKFLKDRLSKCGATIDIISIYKSIMLELSSGILKNITNTNVYQGIIITSSALVKWLFDSARQNGLITQLQNVNFITWHKKIFLKLKEFKAVNVTLI